MSSRKEKGQGRETNGPLEWIGGNWAYDKTLSMEYSKYWNNHWYDVIVFSDAKSNM